MYTMVTTAVCAAVGRWIFQITYAYLFEKFDSSIKLYSGVEP